MINEPLNKLLEEIPPGELAKTADEVLVDYAITSIRDQQSNSDEEAVLHIKKLKRMRDAFLQASKVKSVNN